MKKTLLIFVLLLAVAVGGTLDTKAEGNAGVAEPLSGVNDHGLEWSLPQFSGETAAWEAINRYYQLMAKEQDVQSAGFEITHLSDRYVSIVRTVRETGGNGERERCEAETFALDGLYVGSRLSLSQLLGMEETHTQEHTAASRLVWDLVWQIAVEEAENPQSAYLDDLTMQDVQNALDPESQFYLDGDGNIVFWILSGELAGEMAGVLTFPFAPGELLSAIGEG